TEDDDFTYDRRKEHMLYKAVLNLLAKEHAQAIKYLSIAITQLDAYVPTGCQTTCRVMNEKSSASIENFWMSIDKKLSNERKEHIETKWDIEDDENKTQTYQEIILDVGNNPLYVTEHIEKNEVCGVSTSTIPTTPHSYKVSNDSSNEVEPHSTPNTPTTPSPPPSSHNYKQPRFITNNEYMDMIWSPWQFDAIICEIDIEEKLIGLCEKKKKAKKKSSLSYGIVDLNDSRIMDVMGQSVKFYFEAEMKKYISRITTSSNKYNPTI
ncbi:6639_t:CDS:2, partial [Funneliformis geosporum]